MILSRKLSNALNDQIKAEMWSANLYMSMAVHFTQLGHKGCAGWMRKKQIEELEHAYQLMEFSVKNGGQVVIDVINAVPTGFGTPKEIFEHAAKHEKHLAELVEGIIEMANTENDAVTQDFLKSFVHGQVEEESAQSIVDKFNACGDESLDIVDHQLGKR